MAKRGRDDAPQQQQAKHENPVKPAPPPKRCRDMSTTPVGEGAAGNGRASLEKGRVQEPDAKTWVASRESSSTVSAQVVSLDEAGSAPGELPRWWQLWVGMRGGGRVVDCEELLWGWFPFVDEDFSTDGEKVGWLSIWGDEQEDIWQLKQMNQISSRSR